MRAATVSSSAARSAATRDSRVDVEIYRYAGTRDPWRLVVIDLSSGACTAWTKTFATDQEAYDAFIAMVKADGMASFADVAPLVRH
ncbi:hypothetical protein MOF8_24585 [Methylobacterium oryzae]|uniref:hypothetical protein n=1 Tax=Methylobacterium oryzae TaxID=334852 RepID=UPI002F2D8F2E